MALSEKDQLLTLRKGLKALSWLNAHGQASTTEIARSLKVSRTTAFRILETLTADGFLRKDRRTKKYELTYMVCSLSDGYHREDLLTHLIEPHLKEFSARMGWPSALVIPCGYDMVVRARTDHLCPLALHRYPVGFRVPVLECNSGILHLAYCSEQERREIVREGKESGNPRKALALREKELKRRIEQARRNSYHIFDVPEYDEAGASAPLFINGRFVAGVGMRYIRSALSPQDVVKIHIPLLQEIARKLPVEFERSKQSTSIGNRLGPVESALLQA